MEVSYLKDYSFLKALNNEKVKTFYVKVIVLNKEELPIRVIEGQVTGGSINIDGGSSLRRTCNLTFLAKEKNNDLEDIDNLLSINKKIQVLIGFKNTFNLKYDEIIWLPQGIFVICQPNISHSLSDITISLSCKDKMCLLNGEMGGVLPTSVTFDSYNQETSTGKTISKKQLVYDIIQTLVCNYGNEILSKVFINDVPLEIKQIIRYTGSETLFYNSDTDMYTTNEYLVTNDGSWKTFKTNEDVGYVYTDFTFPGSLISNLGESVCSVLDKIKQALGNYEYYYDIDGNFVFQEIKNYLNNSYDPTNSFRLDNNRKVQVKDNNLTIIDNTNYTVDFNSNSHSVYTFEEGNGLISSFTNTPNYANIKNDFHIWGKNAAGYVIHYHLAIREKPNERNHFQIIYLLDKNNEPNGSIRLATETEIANNIVVIGEVWQIPIQGNFTVSEEILNCGQASTEAELAIFEPGKADVHGYIPNDWRAELYLQGLSKKQKQQRPDIYEQELLDLFDSIYDFKNKKFKADIVNRPNDLSYFIDFLEPINSLDDIAVGPLNMKTISNQEDKISRLYNNDIPDVILINGSDELEARANIIEKCHLKGQPYANVPGTLFSKLAIGTTGYSAQDCARELLYQYTNYDESISINSVPIYYLDVNSRITVNDKASGIYGDYIIKSISLPLDAKSNMSISASRALERI